MNMRSPYITALNKLTARENLPDALFDEVLRWILRGEATEAQIAALLIALRTKGETAYELIQAWRTLKSVSIPVQIDLSNTIDLCGTGGDASGTFNISTAAMFAVRGSGVNVAKHGNRSVSSQSGSTDVLEQLGVNVNVAAAHVAEIFSKTGTCFMAAPNHHPALKHVGPVRKQLGVRTFFNIMGPLLNPAGVKRQLVGAFSIEAARNMAEVLAAAGSEFAVTVHADDGLDEFSTVSPSTYYVVDSGRVEGPFRFEVDEVGMKTVNLHEILGADAATNAGIVRSILSGNAREAVEDIVVLNAAFARWTSDPDTSVREHVDIVRETLRAGKAEEALENFRKATQEAAAHG
jgi:anthranilate phosphoribosyltransferase